MKYLIVLVCFAACAAPQKGWEEGMEYLKKQIDDLKPGLGDIMEGIREHHAKLYFAGDASNWDLAEYQLGEIQEGFDDVVKYHPTFEKSKPAELVPKMISPQLKELTDAVKKKNKKAFLTSFNQLTDSCNRCHAATEHEFIVLKAPSATEFSNLKFAP